MINILEDIKNIKSGKKELREFALTMGLVALIFFGFALARQKASGKYFLASGILLIFLGLIFPRVLKPFQRAWMAFSVVLGFFMSRLVLVFLFYGVLTPLGLLTKLFSKDILDERISKGSSSYWIQRTAGVKDKKSYENQF